MNRKVFGSTTGSGALTLSGTQYSVKFSPLNASTWSAFFQWTGTPTSTMELWATNQPNPDESDDTDWHLDATWAMNAAPAGSASNDLVESGNSSARYYRFKTALSGGSGTLVAFISSKRLSRG